MTGVRLRPEGFEGQCEVCREWWPLEPAHWNHNSGLRRCYACVKERNSDLARTRTQNRTVTPDLLDQRRQYNRDWMRQYRAERRRRVQFGNLRVVA